MKSPVCIRNRAKSVFWLVLLCIPMWGFGIQAKNVSAYQSDEVTPTLTLIPTETLREQIQVTATATVEATLTTQALETITLSPVVTPSVPHENSTLSTPTNLPPVPVLRGQYAADEVLIRFKESATNETIQGCLLSAQATALSSIEEITVWVVQVPFGRVAESIAIISACSGVRYAEPNYMAFIADTIPSDTDWNLQYGLVNIHAPQGWDYSTGSSAVTIAILDSGVDLSHPDLAGKIVPGYDFVNNDAIAQDDFGHGTHVAGIAAASGNNSLGIAGVSWGARIMPVKVLNASGNGSFANVAAGIAWAADNGAQVINLSLGGASPSTVLQDAVNYAYGKGVVLVAAAGNTGSNFVLYPAHYPNVIAVGAVDGANNHAGFSNYGPELSLVAPGASIYSTVIGGYGYKNGTSMAAPYVSGLAAILRGYPGGYSPAGITFALESSALDLGIPGFDSVYGHGLIQMDSAIQSVYITSTPTASLTSTSTLTFTPSLTFTSVVPGNQSLGGGNHNNSTGASVPGPTFTPSLLSPNTATFTSTLAVNEAPQGQESPLVELAALSPPEAGPAASILSFTIPCLALMMILLGIWLFVFARRQRGHREKGRGIL
jgi:thermitase